MNNAIDDILLVLEWLSSTKTLPTNIDAAMERIRKYTKANVPAVDAHLDRLIKIAEDE